MNCERPSARRACSDCRSASRPRSALGRESYIYHRGEEAFQDDHSRDLDLKGLGYEVVRLSERQINEEPKKVAQILAALLCER